MGSVQQQEVTPMRHKGLLGWRYDARCNYMITLVAEPRVSIFGTLREWGVERSEEGRAVYEAWQAVESKFPDVRATYNAIMPDHFHGIVYIMADGVVNLEAVVEFFASEVERRIGRRVWCPLWRDSICLAKGQLHRQIEYVLSNAKRRWIKENNPGLFKKVMGFRHWRLDRASETLAGVAGADSWDFRGFAHDGGGVAQGCEYWDLETGEEIVKPRKGNRILRAFEEQQAYDNKRTEKQQAYDNKGAQGGQATPLAWTAMGNPFLLDAPLLVSVRISTATPSDKIEELVSKLGAKAERGVVLVSPWISPGEKAVKAEALARDGRIVHLLAEGMGRYYKPGGRDFDFCSQGRMLLLSPFAPRQPHAPRANYGKARFEWLNLAARTIGDLAMGFSRAQLAREVKQ
ncbi:MAG: hypothetical protein IKR48_11035 [Kiritimatiellae bacterium]|nr:hypothetical protein [Kiritimatiellia bacterium]